MTKPILGVIGGMGPAAGFRFGDLFTRFTLGHCDQDHFPLIMLSNPAMPRRGARLSTSDAASIADDVERSIATLVSNGAVAVAIPCNSVSPYVPVLPQNIEVFSIIRETVNSVSVLLKGSQDNRVAVIATEATATSGLYEQAFTKSKAGRCVRQVELRPVEQALVDDAIALIKAGYLDQPVRIVAEVIAYLIGRGAHHIVLGCTELSLLFDFLAARGSLPCPTTDSLQVLAHKAVAYLKHYELQQRRREGLAASEQRPPATFVVSPAVTAI